MNRKTLIAILAVALAVGCCIFAFVRDGNADVSFELTVTFDGLVYDERGAVAAIEATEVQSGERLTVDVRFCGDPVTPSAQLGWHQLTAGQQLYLSIDFDRSDPEADPPLIVAELVMTA